MLLAPSGADSDRRRARQTRERETERVPLIEAARRGLAGLERRLTPLRAIRRQSLGGDALGLAGERVVQRCLKRAGWQPLGARLATPDAELDLLMLDGETLVAVEVKTGRSRLGPADFEERPLWRPGHRFAASDMARVRRAAARIAERLARPFRVDLIELVLFEESAALFHHVDIQGPLAHPDQRGFGRVLGP